MEIKSELIRLRSEQQKKYYWETKVSLSLEEMFLVGMALASIEVECNDETDYLFVRREELFEQIDEAISSGFGDALFSRFIELTER